SVGVGVEVEAFGEQFADVAAAAFGEQRVLGTQFHARGVHAVLGIAFTVYAQIGRDETSHHALLVDQCFLSGEARIDFDAQVFGLLGQPATQVTQGNNVIALVVHGLGHKKIGHFAGAGGASQHINVVANDGGIQRSAEFLPVWEQFVQGARLEYCAGENVGA